MDLVEDLDNIDVELDEDFTRAQQRRCTDPFLNQLCDDALDSDKEDSGDQEDGDLDGDGQSYNQANVYADAPESYTDEDLEEGEVKYPIHNPKVKWNKMKPLLGERYENPHQLKLCLTNYAISSGYRIRFQKCDSVRVVAVCATKGKKDCTIVCPYVVRASWMSTERSFQIKKMVNQHKCVRNFDCGLLMNPTWIAKQFLKELIRKPDLKCKDIQRIIASRFHSKVSWSKCYRARCRAMSIIEGKLSDHYARVFEYGQELMRSNRGSTVNICLAGEGDECPTFLRMYTCFTAVKEGWKKGCRRVIGLDGAFLKGQCRGQLLTAIGRDANNQVFPIAWAVVDIENKANWIWFLDLLNQDLALDGGRGACVISDQHKGLLEAAKVILPHVEHTQCARHVYANFRKVYSGLEYKNMFWAVATSTVEEDFKIQIGRIKEVSLEAYEHLMAKDPQSWCRAFIGDGLCCEAMENGVAECFNAIIVHARKRPLLTMLEEIRLYLVERAYNLKNQANNWENQVGPGIIKKMDKFGEDIKNWYVVPSGLGAYEARNGFEGFSVDLNTNHCACRLWDLSGIPCVHAQTCIIFTQQEPVKFISSWFSKKNYCATYEKNIRPVNGSKLWKETPFPKKIRQCTL